MSRQPNSGRAKRPAFAVTLKFLALAILTCGVALAGLAIGPVPLPLSEVLAGLFGDQTSQITRLILFEVRLTRTITGLLVGAALGVTGLLMQTIFRNPLADPYILGISSGASFGVALVVLVVGTGTASASFVSGIGLLGGLGAIVAAALGATATMLLILVIGRFTRSATTLLLIGVMLGYLVSSLVTVMLAKAHPEAITQFVRWGFGSYQGVTWQQLTVLAPTLLVTLALTLPLGRSLDVLLLGERYAETMGLNVRLTRGFIVVLSSVLAGAATAFCGPISFLGIAMPHLARSLFATANHRILLPGVMLIGGSVALLAEIIAQLPGDGVLPLNAVNAAIGAPVVIYILLRRSKEQTL